MKPMPRKQNASKPLTTAQQLGSLLKSIRDQMRKDKGLNGDLDRLPMLTWIMFLKFLDDMEQGREAEALVSGRLFRPTLEPPYRWRDWAGAEKGFTGDDLLAFINNDEAMRPDGNRGLGLFAYLRCLQGGEGGDRRDVIARVFKGVQNRMVSGYVLRQVLDLVNGIHFNASEEIHVLGNLYESLLKEMRDAAGDSGEFYTPRPVVRFMVKMVDPKPGEVVLDPACGTGGFLAEAYNHIHAQCRSVEEWEFLQKQAVRGGEAKPLPYLLAQMNLLLHGLENPDIDPENSLRFNVTQLGDKDRMDVILTNPPFGGEEEKGIQDNFPNDKRAAETALLFLQLIMRRLKRPTPANPSGGRAAVVVPNGILFGDGVAARIKEELLRNYNLHTIVRLPNGVFAPYTPIPSNLLFFDRSGPTREIWYYENPLPEGRKGYTKTNLLQYEEFATCEAWWRQREENAQAWKVDFAALLQDAETRAAPHRERKEKAERQADGLRQGLKEMEIKIQELSRGALFAQEVRELREQFKTLADKEKQLREQAREEQAKADAIYWPIFNLDMKNPNSQKALEHRVPVELIKDILAREQQIIAILEEINAELEGIPTEEGES